MTNMPVCLLLLVPSQYELNVHNLQSCLCFIAMAPLSNRLWALWKDEKKTSTTRGRVVVSGGRLRLHSLYTHRKDIPFCLIWLYSDVWTWTVIGQLEKCEIRCKVLEFDAAGQKQLKELQLQSVWESEERVLKVSHFLSGYTQILILPPRLTGQNRPLPESRPQMWPFEWWRLLWEEWMTFDSGEGKPSCWGRNDKEQNHRVVGHTFSFAQCGPLMDVSEDILRHPQSNMTHSRESTSMQPISQMLLWEVRQNRWVKKKTGNCFSESLLMCRCNICAVRDNTRAMKHTAQPAT